MSELRYGAAGLPSIWVEALFSSTTTTMWSGGRRGSGVGLADGPGTGVGAGVGSARAGDWAGEPEQPASASATSAANAAIKFGAPPINPYRLTVPDRTLVAVRYRIAVVIPACRHELILVTSRPRVPARAAATVTAPRP
jgi:hypothetical protein